MKVLSVVGTRPNFVKVGPVHSAFESEPSVDHQMIHTGQHYSPEMNNIFFKELELPPPSVYLGLGGGSHAVQTAKIMVAVEEYLVANPPDVLMVYGDVNSTLASALVASKLGIPVVHVEAGLRSGDRTMPEELNRIATDSLSDLLLVSEPDGMRNLLASGYAQDSIEYVGNVMIDSLRRFRSIADGSTVLERLGLSDKGYVLSTLHRPATVDNRDGLTRVLDIFDSISGKPILFPVHPRTKHNLEIFGLADRVSETNGIILVDPVGYLDFLRLQMGAEVVLTDSGGIHEETTELDVPCLTLRPNTERPVTISSGTNELVPPDPQMIRDHVARIRAGEWKTSTEIEGWDGLAGERVARAVISRFA
jgi:UDP-N-acetylglucosamine 2-epimerase (non-hydrolysing)